MATTQTAFDQLQSTFDQQGTAAALDQLTEQLLEQGNHHGLFEARRLQLRHRLGLPLLQDVSDDQLPDAKRRELEDGLLDACREVGLLLIQAGQVRDGWMYLRAVGERERGAEAIRALAVDEDNLDEIVEVTVHEGVDVAYGFGLVLENFGTCNAITTFEQALPQHGKEQQQAAAALLVQRLQDELLGSVRADVGAQEDAEPAETTLEALVAERPYLFGENSYHIDTTHLASTVRFARLLEDPDVVRQAYDLTCYGRHLSSQFQYQHEEPFSDFYPAHALYFQAVLGENQEEAVGYFREKAETLPVSEHGTSSIEIYVDLLGRVGRHEEALTEAVRLAPSPESLPPFQASQFLDLGTLLGLSTKATDFGPMQAFCRERDDLLGFATALVSSTQK